MFAYRLASLLTLYQVDIGNPLNVRFRKAETCKWQMR